jgi:hypothetical protein
LKRQKNHREWFFDVWAAQCIKDWIFSATNFFSFLLLKNKKWKLRIYNWKFLWFFFCIFVSKWGLCENKKK